MPKWGIVYEGAYEDDGSLYFPERLSEEHLQTLRKSMGLYRFSNQYLNQTIPDEEQDFKAAWWKTYVTLPQDVYTFAFIDPAISLNDGADFTATILVHVDWEKNWYVSMATRQRITATQTLEHIFKLYTVHRPSIIGIEDVAYQKALLHFVTDEMHRRGQILPIKGVRRSNITSHGDKKSNNSKPFRIRALVPRFEYGKIFIGQGLDDLLLEYKAFPRGSHDDLLDALASIEEIVYYPDPPRGEEDVTNPADPRYERQYIKRLTSQRTSRKNSDSDFE